GRFCRQTVGPRLHAWKHVHSSFVCNVGQDHSGPCICAVICTFGMRAPVGSRTVPDNVAFVLCAEVATAINCNRTPHHLFISCSSTDEADSIKRKFLSLLKPDRPIHAML